LSFDIGIRSKFSVRSWNMKLAVTL